MKLPNSIVLSFGKKSTRSVKDLHQAQVLKWNFYKIMSAVIHSRLLRGGGECFQNIYADTERNHYDAEFKKTGRFTSR